MAILQADYAHERLVKLEGSGSIVNPGQRLELVCFLSLLVVTPDSREALFSDYQMWLLSGDLLPRLDLHCRIQADINKQPTDKPPRNESSGDCNQRIPALEYINDRLGTFNSFSLPSQ